MKSIYNKAAQEKQHLRAVFTAPQDDYIEFDDSDECPNCDGEGVVMACCDDICRGADRCMYRPAKATCFNTCSHCGGSGEVS